MAVAGPSTPWPTLAPGAPRPSAVTPVSPFTFGPNTTATSSGWTPLNAFLSDRTGRNEYEGPRSSNQSSNNSNRNSGQSATRPGPVLPLINALPQYTERVEEFHTSPPLKTYSGSRPNVQHIENIDDIDDIEDTGSGQNTPRANPSASKESSSKASFSKASSSKASSSEASSSKSRTGRKSTKAPNNTRADSTCSDPPSSRRGSSTRDISPIGEGLVEIGVPHVDLAHDRPKPALLQELLNRLVISSPRDSRRFEDDTYRLVKYWRFAQYRNVREREGHCGMLLGWCSEYASGPEAEPFMDKATNELWQYDRMFTGSVAPVQPTFTYGFISRALTAAQKETLVGLHGLVRVLPADKDPLFPFLAQKWVNDCESRREAELEMFRAGKAMCGAMYGFYLVTHHVSNVLDKVVFTMVISPEVCRVFVHWIEICPERNVPQHFMDLVYAALMDDEEQVGKVRVICARIRDWMRETRLRDLKEALDDFREWQTTEDLDAMEVGADEENVQRAEVEKGQMFEDMGMTDEERKNKMREMAMKRNREKKKELKRKKEAEHGEGEIVTEASGGEDEDAEADKENVFSDPFIDDNCSIGSDEADDDEGIESSQTPLPKTPRPTPLEYAPQAEAAPIGRSQSQSASPKAQQGNTTTSGMTRDVDDDSLRVSPLSLEESDENASSSEHADERINIDQNDRPSQGSSPKPKLKSKSRYGKNINPKSKMSPPPSPDKGSVAKVDKGKGKTTAGRRKRKTDASPSPNPVELQMAYRGPVPPDPPPRRSSRLRAGSTATAIWRGNEEPGVKAKENPEQASSGEPNPQAVESAARKDSTQ